MTTISLIECRSDKDRSRHSSTSTSKGLDKTKVAKIGSLTAGNRSLEGSCIVKEIKGLSLLNTETHKLENRTGKPRKPREIDLLTQRPSTTQYYQHTFYDSECVDYDVQTGPLSVTGERLDAISNLQFCMPSTPLHRRKYYISESSNSSSCSECSQCCGRSSPDNPPSSPIQEASYLKLDGKKMSCPDFRSKSELKDFKPGLLKKKSYCCAKCEGRMISHDSLMLESGSPCPSYFRQYSANYAETQSYNNIPPLHSDRSLETREELIIDQPLKDDILTLPELPHAIAIEKEKSGAVFERFKSVQKPRLCPRHLYFNHNRKKSDENEELLSSTSITSKQIFHSSNKTDIFNEETTSQQFRVPSNENNEIHQTYRKSQQKNTEKRAVDEVINIFWSNYQPCENYAYSHVPSRERPNYQPCQKYSHSPVSLLKKAISMSNSDLIQSKVAKTPPLADLVQREVVETPLLADLIHREVAETPPLADLVQREVAETPPLADLVQSGVVETPSPPDLGTPYKSDTNLLIGKHSVSPSISVSIHNLPSISSSKNNDIRIETENFKTEAVNQTSPKTVYSKEEFLGRVKGMESREMLQDIIRECAQGLKDISHRGILPDISARNDFYFEPNTDKRYNRWKRRRRKKRKQVRDGKQQELISPDDSSAEEGANNEEDSIPPERPDSQIKFRRRRRETLKQLFGSEQALLCYDASSDLTSSDRDNYLSVENYFRTGDRASISDEDLEAFKDENNDGMHLSSQYIQQKKYTSSTFLQQLGANIEKSEVSPKTVNVSEDGMPLTEGIEGNAKDIITRVNSHFKILDRQTHNKEKVIESKFLDRHQNKVSEGKISELPQNRNVEGLNVEIIHRGKHAKEPSFDRKEIISCVNGEMKHNIISQLESPENHLIISQDYLIKHGYLSAPDQVLGARSYRQNSSAAVQVFDASGCRQNLSAPDQVLDISGYRQNSSTADQVFGVSSHRRTSSSIDQVLDASGYRQNYSAADQVFDAIDYRQNSSTSDQVLDAIDYRKNSSAADQVLDASDYRQNSPTADQVLDASDNRQNSPAADQVFSASSYRRNSSASDQVMDASDYRQNSSAADQVLDASGYRQHYSTADQVLDKRAYRQNSSAADQMLDASAYRQNSSTAGQVLNASGCRQNLSASDQVFDASSYQQSNVINDYSEPSLQNKLYSPMNSTSECDSDPFIRVETVLRKSQQYGNLSNKTLTKVSGENIADTYKQSPCQRLYSKDRKSEFNSVLNLERSVLKLAKQHHQKNQSLSNKKYSEGQLKPKLPNIHDDKVSNRSTGKGKQSKNHRNILDRFVNPLNVQNVEGSPYLKDSNAVLVTTIHRQRKENPVLKNDKMKREKRSQSRPLSKKLNNSQEKSIQDSQPAETDLSMLTLNELLQTMPGNNMKNFIKKVTKKITCDQSDQDLGKELPALDVKKLNMIVKSYTDSEQEETSLKCLGEQTKSLPNQILHVEPSHPQSYERSLSNLSFSRAFTFSVFDLPDGYREKNKQLQRRAYTAIKSH